MPRRSARLASKAHQSSGANTIASDRRKSKKKNPVPSFFTLPPETRTRVYELVFADIPSRDIARFRIPALTRVSRLMRHESLPIFFADNHFRLIIGSNFRVSCEARKGQLPGVTDRLRLEKPGSAGTLAFRQIIGSFLESAKGHNAVIFRNVTFEVHDNELVRDVQMWATRHAFPWNDDFALSLLSLRVTNGLLEVFIQEGQSHPRVFPLPNECPFEAEDVDAAAKEATAIARGIAARDDFKGFTLEDLKEVAKGFRFEEKVEGI